MNSILDLPSIRARVSRVSVEEYHRQPERNENGRRTELIRGIVVEKMAKSPIHKTIVTRLYLRVLSILPAGYCVWQEQPLTLHDSEPEPDVSIVRGALDDFIHEHARTAALVVEVAVSSPDEDRAMAPLYAEAGIAEYWIVLVAQKAVEVRRRPERGQYLETRLCGMDGILECESLPGIRVALAELFAGL